MNQTLSTTRPLLAVVSALQRLIFLLFPYSNRNRTKVLLVAIFSLSGVFNAFSQVANYTFSESAGTYNAITGTDAHALGWDDAVTSVPIGFNFSFNGNNYTTCSINSNGYITFGTTTPGTKNYTPISSNQTYSGAISAIGVDLSDGNSKAIIYTTTGNAPNRVFTVQWTQAKRTAKAGQMNFQIKLYETSNKIDVVYGTFTNLDNASGSTVQVQVGLRGASNNDYNNRSLTSQNTSWDGNTSSGATNDATCRSRGSNQPTSGRTFTWSPYRAQIISANTGSSNWCAGETRNVSVTIKNTGSAPWIDGGGKDFNIGVKWNRNGTSWADYHVRTDAKNLAPGNTETYNFTITASTNTGGGYGAVLPAGSNNLTFDVVYEGQFWFGNTAGNTAFKTSDQTISTLISTTVSSPLPANNATSVCYSGAGAVSNVSWGAAAGATSYDVYFGAGSVPGSMTGNVTTISFNIGTLAANTTYFWKVVPRNACGITSGTISTFTFKTGSTTCQSNYCEVTSSNASINYINDVEFRGTLNDVVNNNSGVSTGYQNFTGLSNKTRQVAGEGINVFVKSSGRDTTWKAWVDWNRDGTFNNTAGNSEIVFVKGTQAISTSFGFVIPSGTPPGDYVIRIRNYRSCTNATEPCGDIGFSPCAAFTGSNNGEAEDYVITVTANCAAVVNSVKMDNPTFPYCGASNIPLVAKVGTGTTKTRWYDAETGGTMLAETDAVSVDGVLQATYTTPLITTSTTYWVTAYNGTCETIYRKPVNAKIKSVPTLSFNLPLENANFCGEDDRLILTTTGNQEQVTLIDEDFEAGGLGLFSRGYGTTVSGQTQNNNVRWQDQGSPFPPTGSIWSPVISSGYAPNRFAFSTSDYSYAKVETTLFSTFDYPTTNFTSLDLSFNAYYSFYGDTSTAAGGIVEGFYVEVSTNNGGSWTTVKTYDASNPGPDGTPSLGYGTRFRNLSVNLDAYIKLPSVKIRFRYKAYWGDGVAIDNIKLYGQRPLSNSFTWDAPNIGVFQADCITSYPEGSATTGICIKPTDLQLQTISDWNITAYQTVSNTCTSSASITIHNNNKVWDTTASTTWQATDKWLPTNEIPDSGKCVIIKTPVFLSTGNGSAKNVTIEPGGTLTINKDRTLIVTDYIKNNTTVDNAKNLVVESDGNLIQVNNGAANSGNMTAKREVKNLRYIPGTAIDYVYWSSPVSGQSTKGPGGFSPGTPNNLFFYYRESNDRFYETGDPTFTPGRGYAVRAEGVGITPTTYTKTYEFKGTPNNGNISYPIIRSADNPTGVAHGYNLVGNPYPSNIDFNELYLGNLNGDLIYNTAWFWTNNIYTPSQMGSNYGGNNYAIFNGTGGVPASSPYQGGLKPNGIIKVGQAFIVQKKNPGTAPLEFKNTYGAEHDLRKTGTGSIFFQKNNNAQNKFWISLIGPAQMVNSQLIGYMPGATNGYEQDFDAEAFDDYSDLFYSVLENKKLVIQGKSDLFTVEDRVPLGANFYQNGVYTISLDNTEGIFNTGQTIYLKDKQAGITANLSEGSYTFQVTKGLTNGRFEIVYKPDVVLITDNKVKNEVEVYRDSDHFVVKAQNKKITAIQVFDASGRLVYSVTPNSLQTVIPADKLLNSIYVLKISQGGIITTRKIMK